MNAFIAVVFASLIARLGYQMARSPVLPAFATELGAGPELLGVIVAASTITGVFFKLPAGTLSDMFGRKRMMVVGAMFFAFPPLAYPFIGDAYTLLGLRFVHGFATAIFAPVASAYVAGLHERGRGARLGWFASANDIGATAGPMIGGLLLYSTSSFEATYLVVGVLGLTTLAVVLLLPELEATSIGRQTFSDRASEFSRNIVEVICIPPILIAASIEAVMFFGYAAFLGFLPVYADQMGLNTAEITLVLGVQLVAAMLAKPIAGRLSDTFGRKPLIFAGLAMCVVALPLIFRSNDFFAFAMFSALLGLGVGVVTPVTNALIADLVSERRLGTAMGTFGTIFDFGEAAGPIVAGFLIGALGYSSTFDLIAAATLAAAIALGYAISEIRDRPS